MNLKAYQIFYDAHSRSLLDPGFIPYDNSESKSDLLESIPLIDIFQNKEEEWKDASYVGALSWRFREKTSLTAQDVQDKIMADGANKDVYLLTPPQNLNYFFMPFAKEQGEGIYQLANLIDKTRLLGFQLRTMAKRPAASHCNYWLAKPEIFHHYVDTVLLRAINFMYANPEAKRIAFSPVPHRGTNYTVAPFFLEGLFRRYVEAMDYDFEYIIHKKHIGHVNIPNKTMLQKEAEHEMVPS